MSTQRFLFWQKWLNWSNVIAVMVGLWVAFAGNSIFFEYHNAQSADVFFGGVAFQGQVLSFKNWLFGIIGGTIVGFHLLMIMISEYAFKRGERWAYLAMWLGLASWFVIDSGLSLFYGAIHNLILINLPAFLMIATPLLMIYPMFFGKKPIDHPVAKEPAGTAS
ncbi:MAG: hypothetical protein AAF804_16385 [Bacteroidota bacterium]